MLLFRDGDYVAMTQKELIAAMDAWLTGKHSPMAGFSDFAVILARYHGIAVSLSLAIAQAETQCGTDPNANQLNIKGHNSWGYGQSPGNNHGWLFPSWPDGISAVTDWLAQAYVYQGMTTVKKMCQKWVGVYSQQWVDNVSFVMRQFGGDPDHLRRPALMLAGEGTPPV